MRSRILIASFIFLIAAPSYMISERYGITGGSEIKPVDVSVILKCDSIDNVDFVLTPEEGAKNGIIKASINLKDGRVFKSRDCEEVTLFFEKNAPYKIQSTDFFSQEFTLTDKIKKDKNGKYSLTINWKENPILATIMLTYDNAIDRSGIASYATRARFRIIGHTVTPQVKDVESKTFFSLPYNLSPNGHFPQSNRLMVDDNHEFIQYGFPADAGPVFFKWINQDEQDQSILEMLLLSALFGVGISGLIEMVLGRLQLKKPT